MKEALWAVECGWSESWESLRCARWRLCTRRDGCARIPANTATMPSVSALPHATMADQAHILPSVPWAQTAWTAAHVTLPYAPQLRAAPCCTPRPAVLSARLCQSTICLGLSATLQQPHYWGFLTPVCQSSIGTARNRTIGGRSGMTRCVGLSHSRPDCRMQLHTVPASVMMLRWHCRLLSRPEEECK